MRGTRLARDFSFGSKLSGIYFAACLVALGYAMPAQMSPRHARLRVKRKETARVVMLMTYDGLLGRW